MYEFVNRADIEIKFVFYKRLAEKTYHCDFRPANSLVFYIKGGHRFYYSDKQIESRCGDIVLLPYGTNYSNETLSDDTQYYQIDFAIYDNGKPQAVTDEPTVIKNIYGEGFAELFEFAYFHYTENGQSDRLLCISYLFKILALIKKITVSDKKLNVCEDIYLFIKENCTTGITTRDIAENFHISVSLLEKKLKKQYNMSPIRLKNYFRIEKSKQLLAQGYTIDEVSVKTGFCDRYHFTKTFVSFVKSSPSRFLSSLRV
jgi:AraC-like DNA-binding protein